ncbi:MAG TPA: hypothetical protein VKY89_14065 [Thermoanaerobaculia bacterium]|nr:hypothetical protein [Thermoanaerobaculia bacterium]
MLWESGIKAALEELWRSSAFRWVPPLLAIIPFAAWGAFLRGLLSQAWFHGFLAGFCPFLGLLLLAISVHHIRAHRRRVIATPAVATAPKAREESVELFRQLYVNHFAPAFACAGSYLSNICHVANSLPPINPQMAALLTKFVLEPYAAEKDSFGRAVGAVMPGRLLLSDFENLKRRFADLSWRYNCVAKWIYLVGSHVLEEGSTASAQYQHLYSCHKRFIDELRAVNMRDDLKGIAAFLETIEQQLPEPQPASQPSPMASG